MTQVAGPDKTSRWGESAIRVLRERYLRREQGEVVETPEDMCWRVAYAIAQAEANWGKGEEEIREIAGQFQELMLAQLFLPNSPTLMNAGKDNGLQYSACYVLPVEDSLDGIFESIKRAALIHKSGGGTGFAFSRLRSKDSIVGTTGGKASGPVSFMRVFNAATEAVKQGGTRRGANMGILRVDHPDILEFIDCKLDGGITNFNISVAATEEFMRAIDEGRDYDLVDPATNAVVQTLPAREVFDKIVQAAWRTGDPGLVFIDRVNTSPANPTPAVGQIEATNPCGEQPLLPNEACNLGSLNLSTFVKPGKKRSANGNGKVSQIDWVEMERVIRLSVRFLDDVIEVNPYPLPEIDQMVKSNRRIGLGVMGWADMLIQLGIPYDSEEALELADRVMSFIERVGHEESASLAKERGPFPNWAESIYKDGPPLRNATVTTVAPTGTISIIAGCTSGIEPLFALAFRHIVGDRKLTFINPHFERLARDMDFHSDELMEKVVQQGTVHGLDEVPEEVQRVFVTAHEVEPEWHVRTQAAYQRHTDNGVSKTVNLPNEASVEDVANVYRMAYQEGCLGITVFRDGCKDTQVLHVGSGEKKAAAVAPGAAQVSGETKIKPRPRLVQGVTYRAETPLGAAFVTVNDNGGSEPFEVFLNVGKAGSDTAAVAEAIGRLISLTLRLPSVLSPRDRLKEIANQLSGIGGGRTLGFGVRRVRSLPDAIAQVLSEHVATKGAQAPAGSSAGQITATAEPRSPDPMGDVTAIGDLCPDCGHASLVYEEGCQKCYSCGYSEC
jgi:ribonucleoside-diphosphate reductase alpha chain